MKILKILFAAFFLCLILVTSCKNKVTEDKIETKDSKVLTVAKDTIPRVVGIGGIFFMSEDPGKTKDWYVKNLGMNTTEWGSTFEFRNSNNPNEINYLQWSPFKKGNAYFEPSNKSFMINYRVQYIEKLVENMKKNGVTILDKIDTVSYGKFVHILDAEGTKIELWEPVDSVLTQIGGMTIK